MKTPHKYISYNEKRNMYTFHLVLERDKQGNVIQQINKTAKTLEEILKIKNEYMKKKEKSIDLLKEHDFATSPKKEKKITIPTFSIGFQKWIDIVIIPSIKASSVSTYTATLKKVTPYIGNFTIDKISKDLLQATFSAIQFEDNISSGYINKMVNIVCRYYKWEISKSTISENPCVDIVVKRTKKRTLRAFTEKEKMKFLLVASQKLGYFWYLMFYTLFQTGLRRGELLALKWSDIDLKKGFVYVNKTVSVDRINGGEIITSPKTENSNRIVPIRRNLIEAFKLFKKDYDKDDCVFSLHRYKEKTSGMWISTTRISQNFAIVRDLAGLSKELTLHSTRKTFASELLLKGVDIATVKKLGGWESTNVLLKHYAFSDIEHMIKAIRG